MNRREAHIEFVGGPYDGHRQTVYPPRDQATSTLALPVNANVFRILRGRAPGPAMPSRNVALYEFGGPNGRCRFIGCRPAAEFDLHDWAV